MSKNDEFIEEPKPGSKPVAAKANVPNPSDPDGLLTPEQIEEIKCRAKAEIMADKRGQISQKILAEEKQRLRNEEGLTTGNSHADEIVNVTIDVATYSPGININNQMYWHGRTYTVPRHVAETLRDQMSMTWRHQNQIDGKGLTDFYAQNRVANLDKIEGSHKLSGKAA